MKTVYVEKVFSDAEMDKLANTFIKPSQIKQLFTEDVDVFSKDGKLLIRFRKNVLREKDITNFFDATFHFTTKNTTQNRGSTTGSKSKNVYDNPKVMSSILGYFDRWAPNQKAYFRKAGVKAPLEVRETRFSADHPDNYKQIFPLVQDVSKYYKKLLPGYFKKQNEKARETPFKIPGTAFTTITTNVNFQTSIHKDTGDDTDGFGNLVVIENGEYEGGQTCLPQFGIGIDVRQGDILFMNVHEWHGNLPIVPVNKDTARMSIVCYLRTNVWKRTRGKSQQFRDKHLKSIKKIRAKSKSKSHHNKTRRKKKRGTNLLNLF